MRPIFVLLVATGCLAEPLDDAPATDTRASALTDVAIERGATWRYWDRGGDLGSAWRAAGYDDAGWASGPGVFGYGESYLRTVVGYGPSASNKHVTTYFRTTFTVDDPGAVLRLRGELMYDDGAVVYVNGVEVQRASMPAGPITAATRALGHEANATYEPADWNAPLVAGANVIAVEVHQADAASSDLVFDLALWMEVEEPTHNVPPGWTWRYWDGGGDLGTAWRQNGFDDRAWASGRGPLGYGESYLETEVGYGPDASDKHITTYFRTEFLVDDPATAGDLTIDVLYDDGLVYYINGQQFGSGLSMPPEHDADTFAFGHEAGGPGGYERYTLAGSHTMLVAGVNTMAVEVHQQSPFSSDLVFDMAITQQSAPPPPPEDIAAGSRWRYWDRGGTPGAGWSTLGFDDGGWSTGEGPLGYGESYLRTTIGYGPSSSNKYVTSYFRKRFTVIDRESITSMRGQLMYDDGAVVYVNGVEISRHAMPAGAVTPSTLSSGHEIGNAYETFDWSAAIPHLVDGDNVIAVEIHQQTPSSSDLTFDLALDVETSLACPVTGCTRVAYVPGADLYDVWVAPGGAAWAVGMEGMVGRAEAGGAGDWCWCNPGQEWAWLDGVWGTAEDDVWIVGGGASGTVVYHFDGESFERVDIGSNNHLMDVWGTGPDDVWIVGSGGQIRHWNGAVWEARDLVGLFPSAVWGAGGEVWVVGRRAEATHSDATIHRWTGAGWQLQYVHDLSGDRTSVFHNITGTGAGDVWATGDFDDNGQHGLAARWNGAAWQVPAIPPAVSQGRFFGDVVIGSPVAPTGAWFTGNWAPAVRLDGSTWSSDAPGTTYYLSADQRGGDVWAVGRQGRVMRWGAGGWVVDREPTP